MLGAVNKTAVLVSTLFLIFMGLFLLVIIRFCLKTGAIGTGWPGGQETFKSTQPLIFRLQLLVLGLLSFKALSLALICLAFSIFPDLMKPIIIAHTCQ
jgi:hypothetical protein